MRYHFVVRFNGGAGALSAAPEPRSGRRKNLISKKMLKISLIKLNKKHFPLFYKWWNDQELRKWTSGDKKVITKKEVDEILNKHLRNKNGHDFIIMVNKKPVGHILIQKKPRKKNFEIYIAIGEKKYWGKGIGTAAMEKSCRWFQKNFPKEKILELEVLPKNKRAIACYEKVGFQRVKIVKHQKFSETILMKRFF